MKKNRVKLIFSVLCAGMVIVSAVLLFVWASNTFTYSNLYDPDSQSYFQQLLLENGISKENIDQVLSQVDTFNRIPYRGLVTEGWQKASIPFFSYRNEDGFTHLDLQPDNLINCRMTAFQIVREVIKFENVQGASQEEIDPRSRAVLNDPNDLRHYDTLFCTLENPGISSSEEMIALFTNYWAEAGIHFDDSNIRLMMANGASGGILQNFHSAVAIYEENCIWLFEKYDPIHPYQLSRFESEEDLIKYLRKRVAEAEYAAIFANDVCLWK